MLARKRKAVYICSVNIKTTERRRIRSRKKTQRKMKTQRVKTFEAAIELTLRSWVRVWWVEKSFFYTRRGVRRSMHSLVLEERGGGAEKRYTINKQVYDELNAACAKVETFTEADAMRLGVKPIPVIG